jgi:uncharacterized protein YerC
MAQVSRRKLDKDVEDELFGQLWMFLSQVRDPKRASQLYSDLLTETERVILAKRLATALLLIRKKKTQEIESAIAVSASTVSNVSQWLKYCRVETRKMLEKISRKKDWERFFDKVDEVLDKLPPGYYSDWHKAGKEKYRRVKQRSAR